MKKAILILLILSFEVLHAQVISISPNQATYGQTLTTTITLVTGAISMASPPMQLNDIYLKQGNTIIYSINFNLYPAFPTYADSLTADFTIPAVIPPGFYDVHVLTLQGPGSPFPQIIDNVLTNGMLIGNISGYIDGTVYYDANQNGIRDTGEVGIPNQHVQVNPTGYSTLTDMNGHYIFGADSGSLTISVQPGTFTQTSLPLNYQISVPPDTSGNDFGLYEPPSSLYTQCFYLYTHAMRCISPGYSAWYIHNTSPMAEHGSVTVIHSTNLSLNSTLIPPTFIQGDTIYWNYQLQPFGYLYTSVDYMNPPAGDTVSYIVIDSVFDQSGVFQNMYTDSFEFVVSCSVDPNDKSVNPPGEDVAHYTLKNSSLDYTIRFQNTGTDTAYSVILKDTLDSNLDLNTLEIIGWSHPFTMQVDANRVITFTFDNILLPDSNTDEEHSHGYIAYRIHPLSNVANNTVVNNQAFIYFDFNTAVPTNITMNTLVTQIPLGITETIGKNDCMVYPNPVTGNSIIRTASASPLKLTIYDGTGRLVLNKIISGNYLLVKSKFRPGIYYYQLIGNDNTSPKSGKFVVAE